MGTSAGSAPYKGATSPIPIESYYYYYYYYYVINVVIVVIFYSVVMYSALKGNNNIAFIWSVIFDIIKNICISTELVEYVLDVINTVVT